MPVGAIHPIYACPQTRHPLNVELGVLRNHSNGQRYEVREQIPCFLRYPPAEKEATVAKLEKLNRIARSAGWYSALKEIYEGDPGEFRYVTDESRAAFIDFLPLTSDSVVLEIGSSLGQMTPLLARRVKSLYGLEVVPGQALFALERCRQQGLTNVEMACGGDDCRLPYHERRFDVVTVNMVLEWCAARIRGEPAASAHNRMLSEVYRVLKPGGTFFLATKNRFALRLLIGKPDEHAYGLRVGSALPRWLLKALLRLRGKSGPEGVLWSFPRLAGMLAEAGFGQIQSLWASPDPRYPVHIVPTDAASVRAARRSVTFLQGESRSMRLLLPLAPAPLVKYLTHGLVFLARK
jgi:SAM-dependent methyltransferase